ncbi:uncharacterized protein [Hoplias malabaricus]|uniref:uncharacterized protein isoform X1 n=1 Tax=Hoplias malabaricus TaxID=27720 RepID=UPI003461D458
MALLLCGTALLSVSVCSEADFTVEVEPGHNVTLWCQHSLTQEGQTKSAYIYWYRHTDNSVPVYVACKYYSSSSSSINPCYFIPESEQMVMRVNPFNSSLTVTAVNVSDSGLYYCSSLKDKHMLFSPATYLLVQGEEENQSSKNQYKSKDGSLEVFYMLTLVFAAMIVFLLCVILMQIFIVLKYRKQLVKDSNSKQKQKNVGQESDVVNYAALQFSNKINKRTKYCVDLVDPNIVYSSVRQQSSD